MIIETLKTELSLPAYAALVASGDDQAIADLLNAPGAGTVSRGVISKDQFVMALSRGLATIYGKPDSDPVKQAFSGWLKLLEIVTNIDTKDPAVLETLANAVQAGVFTQAEVDAATTRRCSTAEQLDGAGAVASGSEVAAALHDQRQAAYEQAQTALRERAEKLLAENPEMAADILAANEGMSEETAAALADERARKMADNELNGATWKID